MAFLSPRGRKVPTRPGLQVFVTLADLEPATPAAGPPLDLVDDERLLAATEAALLSMAELLGSQARVGSFRLRKWALRRTDDHPALARAARSYVAWASRSR